MRHRIISLLNFSSLKIKLMVYSILLSIVPVILLGMAASYLTTRSIQEEVNNNHQIILKQLETQIESFMKSIDRTSLALANDQTIQQSLKTGITMDNIQPSLNMIDTILKTAGNSDVNFDVSLFYTNFNLVYSSQSGVIRDISYPYPEIIQHAKLRFNGLTIIPPSIFPNMNEMMFIRTVPLNAPNPNGYLILHMDVNRIDNFIDQLDLGGHRKVLIADEDSRIITSKDIADVGTELKSVNGLYEYWLNPGVFAGTVMLDEVEYNVSSIKSKGNGWTYIALTPLSELTSKSSHVRNLMWIIVVSLSCIWIIIGVFGSKRMYNPIQRMVDHITDSNKNLEQQLKKQKPVLKEVFLQQVLRGEIDNWEKTEKDDSGMLPAGNWFYVLVVHMDNYISFRQMFKEKERELLMYGLRNMVEELSEPFLSIVSVSPKAGKLVLIIGSEQVSTQYTEQIVQISKEIRMNVSHYFRFTVSTILSNARRGYASIADSYQEAISLLDYRWIGGLNQHISADMLKSTLHQSGRLLVEWKTAFVKSVAEGDYAKARGLLMNKMEDIPLHLQRPEYMKGLFGLLIGEMDHVLSERGYEIQECFEYDILIHLYNLSSLEEVRKWMSDTVLSSIENHVKTHQVSRQKKLVVKVQQYIQDHYGTDLSLQSLADQFEISPSSLSRMFKEECGQNYSEYMITVRMDKAKEWLIHTDLSINEITDKLRYTSVHNFSRIFKQTSGMPPGKFRKMYREHSTS